MNKPADSCVPAFCQTVCTVTTNSKHCAERKLRRHLSNILRVNTAVVLCIQIPDRNTRAADTYYTYYNGVLSLLLAHSCTTNLCVVNVHIVNVKVEEMDQYALTRYVYRTACMCVCVEDCTCVFVMEKSE